MKFRKASKAGIPPHRSPVTLEELERRIAEVESGQVKAISSDEFDAHIARLRNLIGQSR